MKDLIKRTQTLRRKIVEIVTDLNAIGLKLCDTRDEIHRIELIINQSGEQILDAIPISQIDDEIEPVRDLEILNGEEI